MTYVQKAGSVALVNYKKEVIYEAKIFRKFRSYRLALAKEGSSRFQAFSSPPTRAQDAAVSSVTGKTSPDSVDISTSNKTGKEKPSSGSNGTALKRKSGSSPSASSSVSSSLGGGNSGTIGGEVPSGMKRPAPSAHGASRGRVVSSVVGELDFRISKCG
jgi:hypothetical protein